MIEMKVKEGQEVWVRAEVNVLAESGEDWIEVAFNDTATGVEFISVHPKDLLAVTPLEQAGTRSELRQALEALADKMEERCGDHCSNSCRMCEVRNDLRLILMKGKK